MYAKTEDVRITTGNDLAESDIDNTDLYKLMKVATSQLNADILGETRLEEIDEIDEYRTNKVNGTNTTFYVSKSWDYYFGDRNNDGTITIADIEVWEYKNDHTREEMTVSSIDERGKFVVSSAPADASEVYVSYSYSPYSQNGLSCHKLIKDALCYLTAAYAYAGIQVRDHMKVKLGDLSVMDVPEGFHVYEDKYHKTIFRINSRIPSKSSGVVPSSSIAFELYE